MVDRVELEALDQAHDVRHLDRRHTVRREDCLDSRDEVVQLGDLREDVVRHDQIRSAPVRDELPGQPRVEEGDDRLYSPLPCRLGHVRRRVDPERRYPALYEMLEEISVVGRQLDYEAARVEPEPLYDGLRIACRVRDPRVGVRGVVDVVAEDLLGRDVRLQLDEQALFADPDVQRIERLHVVELLRGEQALTERRLAEIDEGSP